MSDPSQPGPGEPLSERVVLVGGPDGFAYRPGELIVAGERGAEVAGRLLGPRLQDSAPEPLFPPTDAVGREDLFVLRGDVDVVEAVEVLAASGVVAQPNHVLFAHGCHCCPPHPAQRWAGGAGAPLHGTPFYGAPFYGAPFYGAPFSGAPFSGAPFYGAAVPGATSHGAPSTGAPSDGAPFSGAPFSGAPFYGAPFYGAPFYGAPFYGAAVRPRSTARPVPAPVGLPASPVVASASGVRIVVLDTGMAADGVRPAALDGFVPTREHWEVPDDDADRLVDPAAGHGTFIAGLIDLLAPGCRISIERVLSNDGDGDEVTIARRIDAVAGSVDLLNLSFGGHTMSDALGVSAAVRRVQAAGGVVVASAGNEGTCRPTYPAALRGVVGVGAVGPNGPAPFTNYGPWVRACAPGVDVVSRFFTGLNRIGEPSPGHTEVTDDGTPDPATLTGWAQWSGTSFAAPAVVAALAAEMGRSGVDARQAVHRLIDAPALLRIPDLGTVVNVA